MFRAITTRLQQEIADQFHYTEVDSITGGPRDVLWCPVENAFRNRQEQSSQLERDPEANLPFLTFWRTAYRLNKARLNNPLAITGAPTDESNTTRYLVVPVDQVYQIEFWSDDPRSHEAAIEDWYRWSAPPSELVVTDVEGVTLQMPIDFGDAQENSEIARIREIGSRYRATFPIRVDGYVVTSGGEFNTIETIKWNVWDYAAYGDPEEAVKLKEVVLSA